MAAPSCMASKAVRAPLQSPMEKTAGPAGIATRASARSETGTMGRVGTTRSRPSRRISSPRHLRRAPSGNRASTVVPSETLTFFLAERSATYCQRGRTPSSAESSPLEGRAVELGGRHVAGDGQERGGIHEGAGQRDRDVRGAGAAGGE